MGSNRTRKTAEKMASYKGAATRNAARQAGGSRNKPATVRVSPRRKGNGIQKNSTALSVRGKRRGDASATQAEETTVACDKRNPDISPGLEMTSRDDPDLTRTYPSKGFEELERIPETPPRESPAPSDRGRKRGIQSQLLGSDQGDQDIVDSDNESEKPSKKRKAFTTPPRGSLKVLSPHSFHESNETSDSAGMRSPHENPGLDLMEHADLIRKPSNQRGQLSVISAQKSRQYRRSDSRHFIRVPSRRTESGGNRNSSSTDPYLSSQERIYSPKSLSPPRKDELDVLSVSSVTISRLLETFERKMLAQMKTMQREHVTEVRKISDSVLKNVSSEVRHIEGVVSMLTRGMTGLRTSKTTARTTLTEWEQKLNALTPDTDVIFNKDIFGMLLCYNAPNQACMVYRKEGSSDVERAVLSAQTLLFSLQPGDKKKSYTGKVGALHSEFKFIIVQNVFFNVIRDTFQMFRSTDDSKASLGSGDVPDRSSIAAKMMKRPAWLEDKVTRDHINEARSFLERPNQSRKGKIRRTPSPYDIACHGTLRVYRLLGNYLHIRRGAIRSTFFQSLGYLLVPWSEHVRDVDQNSLKLSWYEGEDARTEGLHLDLDEVPHSEQCGFVLDSNAATAADTTNKRELRKLFSEWPDMVLSVEHTVRVVKGNGGQRKHSGGDSAKIHRLFNLIDVACDVCVDYCGSGSRESFLRGHKYSLQCIMIFALLFKAFCEEFMKKVNMNSSAAEPDSEGGRNFPSPIDLELHGLSLKDLIPGPSSQKSLLECRCLRMTRSEFDMYDVRVEGMQNLEGDAGEGELIPMMDIQESEELGIGVI